MTISTRILVYHLLIIAVCVVGGTGLILHVTGHHDEASIAVAAALIISSLQNWAIGPIVDAANNQSKCKSSAVEGG